MNMLGYYARRFVASLAVVVVGNINLVANGDDYINVVTNTPGLQYFWLLNESGTPLTSIDIISGKVATHYRGFPINSDTGGPVSTAGPRPSDGFYGMPEDNTAR